MSFSASDFAVTIHRGNRKVTLLTAIDYAIDPGAKATAVKGAAGVVFFAVGATEPTVSCKVTDGVEAGRLAAFVINGKTGKLLPGLTVVLSGRNDSGSVVFKLEQAIAAEGAGKRAASDAGGWAGDTIKFAGRRLLQSVNGRAWERLG